MCASSVQVAASVGQLAPQKWSENIYSHVQNYTAWKPNIKNTHVHSYIHRNVHTCTYPTVKEAMKPNTNSTHVHSYIHRNVHTCAHPTVKEATSNDQLAPHKYRGSPVCASSRLNMRVCAYKIQYIYIIQIHVLCVCVPGEALSAHMLNMYVCMTFSISIGIQIHVCVCVCLSVCVYV